MFKHKNIKKQLIENKGYGIVALDNISKNTIIIKDIPAFSIPSNDIVHCDIFQLLYNIFTSNKENINQFNNLQPINLDNFVFDKDIIIKKLKELKSNSKTNYLYNYFTNNFNQEELLLICAKYMCNAFEFNNRPVILLHGTILNHSCLPNVIFGKKKNMIYFMTIKDISKGEEICDNYINILLNKKQRQEELKKQYGFTCTCQRCSATNKQTIKELDQQALKTEKIRLNTFGFSKGLKY